MSSEVHEEAVKKALNFLVESTTTDDFDDEKYGWNSDYWDDEKKSPDDEWDAGDDDHVDSSGTFNDPDGVSLKDMQQVTDHSKESGVNQYIKRNSLKANEFATKMTQEEQAAFKDFAFIEFIRMLTATKGLDGDLDEEELSVLKQNPDVAKEMGIFRNFENMALKEPAFHELKRPVRKNIESEMQKLGVPPMAFQKIMNQVLGETAKNMDAIEKQLVKSNVKNADKVFASVKAAFPKWKKSVEEANGDILQIAKDRWDKLGKSRQLKAFKNALTAEAEWWDKQEELGI